MKRSIKRRIVRIDDIMDLLRDNPERRYSVRGMQKALGLSGSSGDWRTVNVMLKFLVRYERIKIEKVYGHIVYYYQKKIGKLRQVHRRSSSE